MSINATKLQLASLMSLAIVSLSLASGCVQSLPTLAHAHIGHSLTAWHDTPQKQALFVVAEQETQNALNELQLAKKFVDRPSIAKIHVGFIVHSLNPELSPKGTGSGYGAIQALQKAIAHIEFAASTKDSSANVVWSAEPFVEHATATLDQYLYTLAVARKALTVDDIEFSATLAELEHELLHCASGYDTNHDGLIGNTPAESGLEQLRDQLSTMIANEVNPPFRPISEDILFGVIRLPNGDWAYDF